MASMLDAVINLKDNFSSTLQQVEQNVGEFSRTAKTMGRDIQRTGRNVGKVGSTLTKSLTVPLIGMGAGAVKVGMEFESSMSQVAATMGITVDEIEKGSKEFELLQKAAKDMGRETQYSASEAAEALNYLALAGYDAEKSAETLPKVLNLAAAGGLELGYAADLVTDSMAALGLSSKETDSFIDQMARTSQKSNTDVSQLGEAILTVGANARDLAGGTLELNTAIGLLGNVGIKGAEGGTKLRNIIMAMTPITDKAAAAFDKLKVDAYDANGNLKPLNKTFGELSEGMSQMNTKQKKEIMSAIFNKQDMAAAASLLAATSKSTSDLDFALGELGISTKDLGVDLDSLIPVMGDYKNEQQFAKMAMEKFGLTAEQAGIMYQGLDSIVKDGSTAWDTLEGQINDSEGAAKEMADTLMHNLKGAFTKIKSALEGVGIKVYEVLKPALTDAAGYVQKFVDKVNALTPEQTEMIGKFVKLAIVIGPALMLIGGLATKIGIAVTAFGKFALAVKKVGLMGAIFTPGVKVVLILAAIVAVAILVYKNWDKLKEIFIKVKDTIADFAGITSEKIEWVKETFTNLARTIWEKIQEVGQSLLPLKETFINLFSKLGELFNLIMPFLAPILAFIGGVFVAGIILKFQTMFNQVMAVIEGIIGFLDGLMTTMSGLIDFIIGVFTGDWSRAWEGLKTMVEGVIKMITSAWEAFIEFITAPVSAVVDMLDSAFHEKLGGIKKAWEETKEFFKHPIKGTINLAKKGWNKLTGADVGNNYKGTDNWKGGLTWVHEKGAEIMDLPDGTRIYPHDKSLEMARLQGQEQVKIKHQIPKVKEVTQKVRQKLESVKIPKISDITQTIKQKVKGKPIQPFKSRNQEVIPLDRNRETKIIEKNNNKKLEITIAKLADQIVVREEADIDKITAKLVKKIEEADLNMA